MYLIIYTGLSVHWCHKFPQDHIEEWLRYNTVLYSRSEHEWKGGLEKKACAEISLSVSRRYNRSLACDV